LVDTVRHEALAEEPRKLKEAETALHEAQEAGDALASKIKELKAAQEAVRNATDPREKEAAAEVEARVKGEALEANAELKRCLGRAEEATAEHVAAAEVFGFSDLPSFIKLVFGEYVKKCERSGLGASASIMGVAFGAALLFPLDRFIRVFSIPTVCLIYTVSDIVGVVDPDPDDKVARLGHLGGAGTGLVFVTLLWYAAARRGVPNVHRHLPFLQKQRERLRARGWLREKKDGRE